MPIRAATQRVAISIGATLEYPPVRSLRPGGAPTLFTNGVELEIMRRYGRWRPGDLHICLYGGSLEFRHFASAMNCAAGKLTGQIRATNDFRASNSADKREQFVAAASTAVTWEVAGP